MRKLLVLVPLLFVAACGGSTKTVTETVTTTVTVADAAQDPTLGKAVRLYRADARMSDLASESCDPQFAGTDYSDDFRKARAEYERLRADANSEGWAEKYADTLFKDWDLTEPASSFKQQRGYLSGLGTC